MQAPDAQQEREMGLTRSHRVQRTGRSSLSVTLPKAWTTALNIRMGDPVVFRQRGDGVLELSFSAERGAADTGGVRTVSIDASGARPDMICRLLVGAYITGQDRIIVVNVPPECRNHMDHIDRVVKHLVGTSLISDSAERVEFEVFVDPSKYQHFALHNRLAQMLHMEVETLRQALYRGDVHVLDQLPAIEDEIDRFYYLIARQVHLAVNDYKLARLSGMANHNIQLGCQMVGKLLETVGDILRLVGLDLEAGLSGSNSLPAEVREDLSKMLGRFDTLLGSTVTNLAELRASDLDETLEEIENANREISEIRERLSRAPRDRETSLLVQAIGIRVLMGLELLKIIVETVIDRVTSPEVVAGNGFRPIVAGTAQRLVA